MTTDRAVEDQPDWTADELVILAWVARSHGWDWTLAHAALILAPARSIGELR